MAKKEGARKTDEAIVASILPDICLTPIGGIPFPVPYSITAKLSLSYAVVENVKMKGKETFTMKSRIAKVEGDEAGVIGGIHSGVNRGHCRPATNSKTVQANKSYVIHHTSQFWMNCAGPDGAPNTVGKLVYIKIGTGEYKQDITEADVKAAAKTWEGHGKQGLSEWDYERAAQKLGVDKNTIKAVVRVEAPGGGFLPSGDLRVLFEGHHFSKLTKGAFSALYPSLSYPKWTSEFYLGGQREVNERLNVAMGLNRDAALKSTSFGHFQILGSNYKEAGFNSLDDFMTAMNSGSSAQIDAFANFIDNKGLTQALRDKDWAKFAKGYNGPGYKKNAYDEKMKAEYERLQKEDEAKKEGLHVAK